MKSAFSLLLVVAVFTLSACDGSTEPTKASTDTVSKSPPVEHDVRPNSTTGSDQPGSVPENK